MDHLLYLLRSGTKKKKVEEKGMDDPTKKIVLEEGETEVRGRAKTNKSKVVP